MRWDNFQLTLRLQERIAEWILPLVKMIRVNILNGKWIYILDGKLSAKKLLSDDVITALKHIRARQFWKTIHHSLKSIFKTFWPYFWSIISLRAGSPLSHAHTRERRRAKRSGGKESGDSLSRLSISRSRLRRARLCFNGSVLAD